MDKDSEEYTNLVGLGVAIDDALSWSLWPSGGLLAEMIFIARSTPEGRSGRPAAAVGVSGTTWNRWMMHARGTGGSRPGPASREKINAAIRVAIGRHWHRVNPTKATVTSIVRWNGYLNATPNRTVNLDDLNLYPVITQFARSDSADGRIMGMAFDFLDAVRRRYGVPVDFEEVESVDIYK